MRLTEKFGYSTVKAVELYKNGQANTPREAWEKAAYEVLEKRVYVEKPCPKSAFLGLCEEGLVDGIPPGNYTRSEKNKSYAIEGLKYLRENPEIQYDMKKFWEIIGPKPKISYNPQLDIVVQLWNNNMIV